MICYVAVRVKVNFPLNVIHFSTLWFVIYSLKANQETDVIIRPDRHSSVIKRSKDDMKGDVESKTTQVVPGFCECGWPYDMLLPRGTAVSNVSY